ncbi:MAG TPA: sugar transferase [Nannocystis exedens]|nr:sugar transferase [Nannocystis exedens]
MRARTSKRILDLALLLPLLPLFAVVTGLLSLVVLIGQGRPIFFRQQRLGLGGEPFGILKLRTMTTEIDPRQRRATRLGRWLRQRGLDELPQLFNVLKGEMSLVGPRPLTATDADRLCTAYPPFRRRFAVPPGLTGLAQICQAQGPELTAELEYAYVRRQSVAMDLMILFRTAWMNAVGKRRGALRVHLPWIRGARAVPR